MTPLDPIGDPNIPTYKAGELPVGFVLLLWDGKQLIGPTQITNPAVSRMMLQQKAITHFMVIPTPE
jgi:hypothetical protein